MKHILAKIGFSGLIILGAFFVILGIHYATAPLSVPVDPYDQDYMSKSFIILGVILVFAGRFLNFRLAGRTDKRSLIRRLLF